MTGPRPDLVWPPSADTRLRGRVVELTPVRPEQDAEELFAALDHDDVWRHVAGRPKAAVQYADALAAQVAGGRFVWTVRLHTSYGGLPAGAVVGTQLLLAHAFEELGAGRVQLKTDERNHRSRDAIARLGGTYEGTLRSYQRRADGSLRDTVMFSILAEQWPAVREGLDARLDDAEA